jgi:hypothetical protein
MQREQDRHDGAEDQDHADPLSAGRRGAAGQRAPIALGAMSDAKTTAAMSVLVVPSWSAATDGPNAW